MSLKILSLISVFFIAGACNHRLPVDPFDGSVTQDGSPSSDFPQDSFQQGDTFLLPHPDLGPPEVCANPLGVTTYKDPRGNYTLALNKKMTAKRIFIAGAKASDSATAISRPAIAGLAATRATAKDLAVELAYIKQSLVATLNTSKLGILVTRTSGTAGKRLGYPDIKEAIWDVALQKPLEPGALRNLLIQAVMEKPASAFSNLPGPVTSPGVKLVIKLSVVRRPAQIAIMAAVALRPDLDNPKSALSLSFDDLGNGTAMAGPGATPKLLCDQGLLTGVPKADIIWIIDESGSMNDNRKDIISHAANFFNKAIAAGLDFRMGVAGMKTPSPGIELGKFCSEPGDKKSDGGQDRFLLPSEKTQFEGCIENPPYYEGGSEHGLNHGYWAIKRHLPRADNQPDKIRKGASLSLIFVTDEAAQELKGSGFDGVKPPYIPYSSYKSCNLNPGQEQSIKDFVKPLSELFSGKSDPGGVASIHVIGGVCNNGCNAEVAYGYKELISGSGGQLADVCQKDLGATLQVIIQNIMGSASQQVLKKAVISSTLAVSINGVRVPRNNTKGFAYNPISNSLTFNNVKIVKGQKIIASYYHF